MAKMTCHPFDIFSYMIQIQTTKKWEKIVSHWYRYFFTDDNDTFFSLNLLIIAVTNIWFLYIFKNNGSVVKKIKMLLNHPLSLFHTKNDDCLMHLKKIMSTIVSSRIWPKVSCTWQYWKREGYLNFWVTCYQSFIKESKY